MAITIPKLAVGDIIKSAVNNALTKIEAYLNAIPGSALIAGSVPNSKLSKNKAHFKISLLANQGELAGVTTVDVDAMTFNNLDGASNASWRITGWSFHSGAGSPALNKVAGSKLDLRLDGAAPFLTILLDAAGLALGTPINAAITPVGVTSGQVLSVDYTAGGATAEYPAPHLVLDVSVDHVSD